MRLSGAVILSSLLAAAAMTLGCNIPLPTRPTPREPLDVIWERRMLEGRGVRIWLDEKWQPIRVDEAPSASEIRRNPRQRTDPKEYHMARDPHAITVLRHVEGYWRNGGWELTGGLLGRATAGQSTFELYGKAIIRTPVHLPAGMLHNDPPSKTSYEFFLVKRGEGSSVAVIVRSWAVQADDVVPDKYGHPTVNGILSYDSSTDIATVSIKGLKRPIEERVDTSAAGQGSR